MPSKEVSGDRVIKIKWWKPWIKPIGIRKSGLHWFRQGLSSKLAVRGACSHHLLELSKPAGCNLESAWICLIPVEKQ